jgi:hypothetical protein
MYRCLNEQFIFAKQISQRLGYQSKMADKLAVIPSKSEEPAESSYILRCQPARNGLDLGRIS